MLDEFPALGRLDFFESALAFMAGYGLRAFLIAQSLNQIEKAYGPNNAILDNCHVRVAFATNDERTAKRISDALGTATELRAQRNYAGHRLSPWLGHLMVSRQESARALLTPGEVMQLPATDEIVMVSGQPPVRARKLRYFDDENFASRVLAAPALVEGAYTDRPNARPDDWTGLPKPKAITRPTVVRTSSGGSDDGESLHRHPEIGEPAQDAERRSREMDILDEPQDHSEDMQPEHQRQFRRIARLASLDPSDGIGL
jgi:type IV secretion system protein VirD4